MNTAACYSLYMTILTVFTWKASEVMVSHWRSFSISRPTGIIKYRIFIHFIGYNDDVWMVSDDLCYCFQLLETEYFTGRIVWGV